MTVCPSGSEPRPGAPVNVHLEPSSYLTYLPPALQWLAPYAPYLPPVDIDFSTFCTFEPPTTETITLDDLVNLLSPSAYQLAFLAGEKIAAWVHLYLWYQWCQCISATTPSAPSAPVQPSGAPVINPVGTTSDGVCLHMTTDRGEWDELAYLDLIGRHPVAVFTGDTMLGPGVPLPTGATSGTLHIDTHGTGMANGSHLDVFLRWYTDTPTELSSPVIIAAVTPTVYNQAFTIPSGATQFCLQISEGTGLSFDYDWVPEAYVDIHCVGTNPRVSGCCPADGGLRTMLQQAIEALRDVNGLVTLIQRQGVPFGRIDGTAHTGLTGQGTLTISDLLGARVEVTTLPERIGRLGSDPEFYYDVGSISWGSADGHTAREILHTSPQLSFPRAAGQHTRLTYSLLPGVEATITEIVREA